MKAIALLIVVSTALAGCASSPSVSPPSSGRFVMAGPTNAIAPQLSMRWQHGLLLDFESQAISEITFSCDGVPGTAFTTKGAALRRLSNGSLFAEGPVLLVSKDATPWLFENATTATQCKAVVSRPGQSDVIVGVAVRFTAASKAATLFQLKEAHDFNAPNKKSPGVAGGVL